MRHLSRNLCNEDVKQIEHLQDSLCAQFAMLDQSQLEMSRSSRLTVILHDDDTFSQLDDLDDDDNEAAENSSPAPAPAHDDWLPAVVPVERRIPCMPSTYEGTNLTYRTIELVLQGGRLVSTLQTCKEPLPINRFNTHMSCVWHLAR